MPAVDSELVQQEPEGCEEGHDESHRIAKLTVNGKARAEDEERERDPVGDEIEVRSADARRSTAARHLSVHVIDHVHVESEQADCDYERIDGSKSGDGSQSNHEAR